METWNVIGIYEDGDVKAVEIDARKYKIDVINKHI